MSYFTAKMHEIRLRLWLRPRPRWGSLQCSPRPPSWTLGALLLREGRGKGRKEERGGEGGKGKGKGEGRERGREGTPQGLVHTPMFEILENTLFESDCDTVHITHLVQGRSYGGYIGIYTSKINPSKLFMG